MTTLTNSFEAGTSGTTISAANSNTGGASGFALDSVTIGTSATLAFDNTHAAHGTLACKTATGGTSTTSFGAWSTSLGTVTTVYFRAYLYFTANPGGTFRVFAAFQGATLCGGVAVGSNGKIVTEAAAGSTVTSTTATIPTNQWFRLEGFVTGSNGSGQIEAKLFKTADSTTQDETTTTSAAQSTTGQPNAYRLGVCQGLANVTAFWMDDIGVSDTGYIGPAVTPVGQVIAAQQAVQTAVNW